MRYRKKPVIIHAVEVSRLLDANFVSEWPTWVTLANRLGDITISIPDRQVRIKTREGEIVGTDDDMLIRGVVGELYPCKKTIFAETYEPVDE